MKLTLALAILAAVAVPAAAQQAVCGYGQPCQNGNPVPFPVINPMQGLKNILPHTQNQPPPTPTYGTAPIATPPPVMPPGH